jgi:hypothetical protein
MGLWAVPHILWCVHRTPISAGEIGHIVIRTLAPGIFGGTVAYGLRLLCGDSFSPVFRLALESMTLLLGYFGMLWFASGQRSIYVDIFRGLRTASVRTGP